MWEPMSPVSRSPEPKEAALMLRASAISSSDSASIASCAADSSEVRQAFICGLSQWLLTAHQILPQSPSMSMQW